MLWSDFKANNAGAFRKGEELIDLQPGWMPWVPKYMLARQRHASPKVDKAVTTTLQIAGVLFWHKERSSSGIAQAALSWVWLPSQVEALVGQRS
ncbi:hypothetical protein G6321_00002125 (plasmid) [Bradyrhizobium barranii subsp. barranii]|uniref:Uncharacterized protein n=1 Tax=Bradyrhizobium barranii subsp. barranii TaxID=2823807 RepID=A0A7Z0QNI5_9BRAD|nr:hypothetical protein [Bradyrhizobium barranii]UGX89575.1 hypothetical protein G6321_00002125 [Bradyrhizobium barranii subsp. barranii]